MHFVISFPRIFLQWKMRQKHVSFFQELQERPSSAVPAISVWLCGGTEPRRAFLSMIALLAGRPFSGSQPAVQIPLAPWKERVVSNLLL